MSALTIHGVLFLDCFAAHLRVDELLVPRVGTTRFEQSQSTVIRVLSIIPLIITDPPLKFSQYGGDDVHLLTGVVVVLRGGATRRREDTAHRVGKVGLG